MVQLTQTICYVGSSELDINDLSYYTMCPFEELKLSVTGFDFALQLFQKIPGRRNSMDGQCYPV